MSITSTTYIDGHIKLEVREYDGIIIPLRLSDDHDQIEIRYSLSENEARDLRNFLNEQLERISEQ